MKILIFGSNGMAGHVIVKYMQQSNFEVYTAARSNADFLFDVTDRSSIDDIIDNNEFDYVINCVGLLVAESGTRPDRAILINAWFPHYLAYKLQNKTTRLIHLSTDCVFDGSQGPYIESDNHTEKNNYGRSKSLGEVNNNKDVTFRMSIIGPELKNGVGLFNFIYNNTDTEIPGWDNAFWNGLTTLELARCIHEYMLKPNFTGLYHLVNNNVSTNKFELLQLINEVFELNKKIIRSKGPKDINKILVDTRQECNFKISNYYVQLLDLKNFITE